MLAVTGKTGSIVGEKGWRPPLWLVWLAVRKVRATR